jgi:hypothetical protein
MIRYLLTSPKVPGHIELVYKDNLMLASINTLEADLNYEQLDAIIKALPLHGDDIANLPKGLKVTKADFEVSFDDFWKQYKKKVNRLRCETPFNKLSNADKVACIYSLREYYKCLQRTSRKELDPENYIKNRSWENDWKSI